MDGKPPRADSQYLPDPSIAVPHHHIKKQFLSLPGSVKVFVPPSEHSSEDDRAAPQPEPIQLNGNQPEKPGAATGLIGVYKIGKNYAAQITIGGDVDVEWYAVKKEHDLADKCAVHNQATGRTSFFWTTMSQNGNAPAALGKNPNNCLPQCYYDGDAVHPGGYPSAVNASKDRCPMAHASSATHGFNNLPMNQAKVLVGLTDPSSRLPPQELS